MTAKMNIGMITCNYYMRIYGYKKPEPFAWGDMTAKYRAEFNKADFMKLAREIRDLGYDNLEIWEPTFSHMVYTPADASTLAGELKAMGFAGLVYCIGGWGANDAGQVAPAYAFAKALGAPVVTGCVNKNAAGTLLPEIEKHGRALGIRFAIENHPEPNFCDPADVAAAVKGYETIGANIDVGIYHSQGFDVMEAARMLMDMKKIYHVHFKDTIRDVKGCQAIGEGDAPMATLARRLRDWGYEGTISVEYEYDGDPAPGLIRSLAFIRGALASY